MQAGIVEDGVVQTSVCRETLVAQPFFFCAWLTMRYIRSFRALTELLESSSRLRSSLKIVGVSEYKSCPISEASVVSGLSCFGLPGVHLLCTRGKWRTHLPALPRVRPELLLRVQGAPGVRLGPREAPAGSC